MSELFSTQLAFVRLFASVSSLVNCKITCSRESLTALVAFEGPFSSVNWHVLGQVACDCELLPAFGTFVTFDGTTSIFVSGQLPSGIVHLAACAALVLINTIR